MKKIISVFICLALLVCACVISTRAVPAPHLFGDVNCDGKIEITDAVEIQRALVGLTEFSSLSEELADVDADSRLTIMDSTMIQMKLAKIIPAFNHDDYGLYTYVTINNITADFDTGKAMVGVPVTFNVSAVSSDGNPLRYVMRIDGINVAESEESTFTYEFERTGEYCIEIGIYNKYNEEYVYDFEYRVVESTDDYSLIIGAVNKNLFYFNESDDIVITANSYGGTAPYEYRFEMNEQNLKQDYSEDNSFSIGKLPIGRYEVNVYVKDADENIANEVYIFEVEDIRVG
ncbi:MAG: hypothetical protein IJ275_03550 [Ruminococcus sp.]|nr:hypothetical protein [Ruminococcus sp.]